MSNGSVPGSSCVAAGTIIYTAPNTPGLGGFTLNGRFFAVEIKKPYFDKPIITVPVNNEVWTSNSVNLIADLGQFHGGNASLLNYDLYRSQTQIAEDSGFTLNVQTTNNDYSGIQGLFENLVTNKLYYLRTRFTSWINDNGSSVLLDWSEWSDTVSIATQIEPLYSEIQILTDPVPKNSLYFGHSVDLSIDGNLLVIGEPGKNSGSIGGSVSMFAKQLDNTYVPIIELLPDGFLTPASNYFGNEVALSINKDYLFVAAPNTSGTFPTEGVVYVLAPTTPNDWTTATLHATINSPNPRAHGWLGKGLVVSKTVNPIFAISGDYDDIYIYRMVDGVITLDAEIQTPEYIYDPGSGSYLSMSDDGTRLVVGAKMGHTQLDGNSNAIQCGVVYIYDYNGTTWNLTTTLTPDDPLSSYQFFGNVVNLSPSGNLLFVGDEGYSPTNLIYAFELINGTWTKTQKFTPPPSSPDGIMATVAFSGDEQYVIIGNDYSTGHADVYTKVNNVWTNGQQLNASDQTAGYAGYAYRMAISRDKHQLVIASYYKEEGGFFTAGAVYIYYKP